jgi:uncharacterized protein (UPF0333 family)
MPKGFYSEESGQAGLEYILLIGGIVVTAVILFAIYQNMTKSSAEKLYETEGGSTSVMSSKISSEVSNIY